MCYPQIIKHALNIWYLLQYSYIIQTHPNMHPNQSKTRPPSQTYRIKNWKKVLNVDVQRYTPFIQQLYVHPAYDNTHILAHELYPNYTVIHLDHKGKKLGQLVYSYDGHYIIQMLTDEDVLIMRSQQQQRGKLNYFFTVWNLRTHQSVEFQHFTYKKKYKHEGVDLFVFRNTNMFCVCDTEFKEWKKYPEMFTLTYYRYVKGKKQKNDPIHLFRHQLKQKQSELYPKPMKINERGGVAFINQAHVKSNFISLKMYELDTKVNPNKGKLNRYQFQHGLLNELPLSNILITQLWQIYFPIFYLKLQTSLNMDVYKYEQNRDLFQQQNGQKKCQKIQRQFEYFWNVRTQGDRHTPYKPIQKYYQSQFIFAPRKLTNYNRRILVKNPSGQKIQKNETQLIQYPIYIISKFRGNEVICGKVQTKGTDKNDNIFYPVFFGNRMVRYQFDDEQIIVKQQNLQEMHFQQIVLVSFLTTSVIPNCDQELLRMIVQMTKSDEESQQDPQKQRQRQKQQDWIEEEKQKQRLLEKFRYLEY